MVFVVCLMAGNWKEGLLKRKGWGAAVKLQYINLHFFGWRFLFTLMHRPNAFHLFSCRQMNYDKGRKKKLGFFELMIKSDMEKRQREWPHLGLCPEGI